MKSAARLALCITALVWAVPALAQDPAALPAAGAQRADPAPWVDAFARRFLACLATERPGQPPDDRASELVAQMAAALAPRVLEEACWADAQAMGVCAAAIENIACDALHSDVDIVVTPPVEPPPVWAVAWARGIRDKVLGCYEAEQGVPLDDPAILADMTRFADGLAAAMAPLAAGCTVDEEKLDSCRATLASMECSALAAALEPGAQGLVQTLMAGCEGFLQCGLDTGDDDGTRIAIPGVDEPGSAD